MEGVSDITFSGASQLTCYCGKTFPNAQRGAWSNHTRTCRQSQKRVSEVTGRAKEVWQARKRQRLESNLKGKSESEFAATTTIGAAKTAIRMGLEGGAAIQVRVVGDKAISPQSTSRNGSVLRPMADSDAMPTSGGVLVSST
jgi:hypothetical protein